MEAGAAVEDAWAVDLNHIGAHIEIQLEMKRRSGKTKKKYT